jgi:hypothetical protein
MSLGVADFRNGYVLFGTDSPEAKENFIFCYEVCNRETKTLKFVSCLQVPMVLFSSSPFLPLSLVQSVCLSYLSLSR